MRAFTACSCGWHMPTSGARWSCMLPPVLTIDPVRLSWWPDHWYCILISALPVRSSAVLSGTEITPVKSTNQPTNQPTHAVDLHAPAQQLLCDAIDLFASTKIRPSTPQAHGSAPLLPSCCDPSGPTELRHHCRAAGLRETHRLVGSLVPTVQGW